MKILSVFFTLFTSAYAITKGMNFYGLETQAKEFVCAYQHPVGYYIDKLNDLGFNSLRVPFSLQWVLDKSYFKMDNMFKAVAEYTEMTVILDMHRIFNDHQAYSPTESWVTLDIFINGWKTIIRRYYENPQLVGLDIFNEYQGTDPEYWNNMAFQIVSALEEEFPERFIFYVGGVNWGGNIHDINLEHLPYNDRIVYTIHKYHFSGNDENDWNYSFGPFAKIPGKVMVGEWGFKTQLYQEKDWAYRFVKYLKQRNITNTYFWTIAHSGDTDGLWYDDCENINWEKYTMIKSLWEQKEPKNLRLDNSTCIPYGREGWMYEMCL